jgi:hypothetical protein
VAGVQLLSWSDEVGIRTTTTDGEGRYRLELRVGTHALGVSAPFYGEETRAVEVKEGGQQLHLDLSLKSGRARVAPGALSIPSDQAPVTRFTMDNPGTREVYFDLYAARGSGEEELEALPWIRIEPQSGTLAPGAQQTFTVTVDRAAVPPGSHQASILIWTDTPWDNSIRLPLQLVVADRAAPPVPGRGGSGSFGELRAPSRGDLKQGWRSSAKPIPEGPAPGDRAP